MSAKGGSECVRVERPEFPRSLNDVRGRFRDETAYRAYLDKVTFCVNRRRTTKPDVQTLPGLAPSTVNYLHEIAQLGVSPIGTRNAGN